ncbi:type III secretion system translocon subunit SctE [Pantoea sp. SORGH_AS_0659]|uniref:type III secretion system translocon subunit SctE n=1 Tax=Pantoea sp. SORGH_AS_0659 TaxID=3062597 RepID=UPI00285948E0|nr:type III secretion system translocon subunit SctE [Pantoea sp. SORGH_AS_0659]MDR6352530.1 invasin B [Pantoea sp. SORGH_AS_0659]
MTTSINTATKISQNYFQTKIPAENVTTDRLVRPKEYDQRASSIIAASISSLEDEEFSELANMPELRQTTSGDKPLSTAARILISQLNFSKFRTETADAGIGSLLERMNALAAHNSALSEEYRKVLEDIKTQFDGTDSELGNTSELLSQLIDTLASKNSERTEILKKMEQMAQNGVPADDAEYLALAARAENLGTEINTMKSQSTQLESKVMVLTEQLDSLKNQYEQKLQQFRDGSTNASGSVIHNVKEINSATQESMSLIQRISERINSLIKALQEANVRKLEAMNEINRQMSENHVNTMDEKNAEFLEKMRKAEESQKMSNCISKIFGALATAIGALTMVFGGAGAVIMAIGLTMLVGDEIYKAVTGESLIGKAMQPLMDHVFTPLMNLIATAVDKIFGNLLPDSVRTAISMVLTIALVIAVAYVAKSAGKKLFEKFAQNMVQGLMLNLKSVVSKITSTMPQMLKNASQSVRNSMSKITQNTSAQNIARYGHVATELAMLTSATAKGAGDIVTAQLQVAMAEIESIMKQIEALMELLSRMMKESVKSNSEQMEFIGSLNDTNSSLIQSNYETGKKIMKNMSLSV